MMASSKWGTLSRPGLTGPSLPSLDITLGERGTSRLFARLMELRNAFSTRSSSAFDSCAAPRRPPALTPDRRNRRGPAVVAGLKTQLCWAVSV